VEIYGPLKLVLSFNWKIKRRGEQFSDIRQKSVSYTKKKLNPMLKYKGELNE